LKKFEISTTLHIQPFSKRGFARAEIQARRTRPDRNLKRKHEKPTDQTRRIATAIWLKTGEADTALIMSEGIASYEEEAVLARALFQSTTAPPSFAECQAGSSSVKRGSASVARIAIVHTWCRNAEEQRRRAIAVLHAHAKSRATLTLVAARSADAVSKLANMLMVSSPFCLSR
jgi:hypothetical protein